MNVGIVGTGLIGASIGMRARESGARLFGYDASEEALNRALDRGAIDEAVERNEIYARCETIVIALPPMATCDELQRLGGVAPAWRLLLDVASIKRVIMKAARSVERFVGTHPLAGAESRGPEHADAAIFKGRTWCYVPSGTAELDERACDFISMLGASPLAIAAAEHDAALALTSHLPQLVAWLLGSKIRSGGPQNERLCGPAGLEILRLSRSSTALWNEILGANADNVAAAAGALAAELREWRSVDEPNGP